MTDYVGSQEIQSDINDRRRGDEGIIARIKGLTFVRIHFEMRCTDKPDNPLFKS